MRLEATEQEIQKTLLDYLKLKGYVAIKHRNVGIYKRSTDSYIPLPEDERGISDIIACSPNGTFVAIEVKRKRGKPSDAQIAFIETVNRKGGIGAICYSLEDLIGVLAAGSKILSR